MGHVLPFHKSNIPSRKPSLKKNKRQHPFKFNLVWETISLFWLLCHCMHMKPMLADVSLMVGWDMQFSGKSMGFGVWQMWV